MPKLLQKLELYALCFAKLHLSKLLCRLDPPMLLMGGGGGGGGGGGPWNPLYEKRLQWFLFFTD